MLPDGAMLSRLCQAELRFLKPKKRDRLGDAAEPMLCMSENDACDIARGRRSAPATTLLGRGENDCEYRESRALEKKPLSIWGSGLASGIEYTETPSAIREEVLENDDVDIVVATYTINDERRQRITFAGPYYQAGQTLMVRAGEETEITGPDALGDEAIRVCSVEGSTPSENIREYLASPEQLVLFEVYDDCVTAMQNGQVQATTTDNVILTGFVAENEGEFKLVGEQFTEEPYGIGIAKGDVDFCEFINSSLQTLSDDGAYEEAWTSTAGEFEGTEVPTLPAADTCA